MKPVVVVVEDQADIRKLVRMTLSICEAEVYEADSGDSGLRLVNELRPPVVLMDIMMPGEVDGLEACRRIKQDPRLNNTRVVMLTARGQEADLAAGKAAGADAYLVKPFSPLQLLDTVAELGQRAA
jgi:CheY-like chemotaxis protein